MKTSLLSILAALLTAGATSTQAEAPSFDCAASDSSATDLICEIPALAELDRELDRLYRLAVAGPNMTDDRLSLLRATQRGWIGGRDDCWKASVGLERCVRDSYILRIDELRTGYADARTDDDAGISLGPFAYRCEGLDALVSAVFVGGAEPATLLKWRNTALVLDQIQSGSGARYTRSYDDGAFEFWTQGDSALLTLPETGELSCEEEPTG